MMPVVRGLIVKRTLSARRTAVVAGGPDIERRGAATVRPVRRPDSAGEVKANGEAVTPKERRRRVAVESRGDTPTGAETEMDVVATAPEAKEGSTRRGA
jgi:hypothetical protein